MPIEHYGLYGEPASRTEPGFVHIEDIAVRSREVEWRIRPHRHGDLFQLVVVTHGSMGVQIDDDSVTLASASAVSLPAGVVHGFEFAPDTEGCVLSLASTIVNTDPAPPLRELVSPLLAGPCVFRFATGSVLLRQLRGLLDQLDDEFSQAESGRDVMLERLAGLVLLTLARQLNHQQLARVGGSATGDVLAGFRDLLERHYRAHWSVAQYAAALNLSVSSLNRHCKTHIGVSPSALIHNRIMVEAKRRLIYTRDTADRIAHRLGFKDPAYFSRFFARHAGAPPAAYRRRALRDLVSADARQT